MSTFEETARKILAEADVRIGGDRPQDIQVHDNRLYARVIRDGDLGLGEAYMDGWWDANQLDVFFAHLLQIDPMKAIKLSPGLVAEIAKVKLFNQQSTGKTKSDLSHHYDIGNELYEQFLDKRMIYSCAYWKDARTLDQAKRPSSISSVANSNSSLV
ncbi:class I SAM-dependent methyltransferase [Candidatus Mycosynbacter amalyticus]|uniref:class I SAM-dependent methyltransferase n=1 Tax=Candidatus Mycosynbacter amalyticus TaxID=2665156 RepID=UPI0021B254BC|nr:class I SAM-dependent methyltransferase [Candidatus Mycosynbacter amalyticus]